MKFSVAIEGVDGVGKTTLIQSLNLELHNLYKTEVIRLPGETEAGSALRDLLKSKTPLCREAQIQLFLADMWNTYEYKVKNSDADLIIYDRSFLSTLVYQELPVDLTLFPIIPSLIIYMNLLPIRKDINESDRYDSSESTQLKDKYKFYIKRLRELNPPFSIEFISHRNPSLVKKLIVEKYLGRKKEEAAGR